MGAFTRENELVTTGLITALSVDDAGLTDVALPALSAPGIAALALLIAALGLYVLASPAITRASSLPRCQEGVG